MAKQKSFFACQECGSQSPKWLGRCPDCGSWNSLVEEQVESDSPASTKGWRPSVVRHSKPISFDKVEQIKYDRITTGIKGMDRVTGGGMVPGSLVLLAGEPGAGKSTLMLQVAGNLARTRKVLYVSGEESEAQVKMRGDRLGISPEELFIYSETELERILSEVKSINPDLLIIDSVQTMFSPRFTSAPGSVTQVRETAAQLLITAKSSGIPIFLVGHVNKDGQVAGPKTMEHIVDAVLMLEGERAQSYRVARAIKNRFGPVSELSVFEMQSKGLIEVENPSERFLAERAVGTPGSSVTATVEGTRPFLVEVQALLSPIAYGAGRRTAQGFDHNRLALLLAILERRGGLQVAANDVFVNVVGGVRLDEPAVDLAVAMALASSLLDRALPDKAVFLGELGLGGEIRSVTNLEMRLKEAAAIGLNEVYIPFSSAKKAPKLDKLQIIPCKNIEGLLSTVFRG